MKDKPLATMSHEDPRFLEMQASMQDVSYDAIVALANKLEEHS